MAGPGPALGLLFGLCAFATFTIWYPGAWLGLARDGLLLLTAGYVLMKEASRPVPADPAPAAWVLPAVLIWCLFQTGFGVYSSLRSAAASIVYWATSAALFAVGLLAFRQEAARRRFLEVLTWFACGVVLSSVVLPTLPFELRSDMVGPFQNRNTYCSFVELTLPLLFWRAEREPGRRWLWLPLAGLFLVSVLRTGSRAGAVLIVAEVILIAAVFKSRRLVLAPAAIALASCLAVSPDTLLRRLQFADPLVHRREILASASEMVAENALVGFGPGSFRESYPAYARFDVGRYVNHVHNDWVEWAVEGGMAVPVLLLAVWIRAFANLPRAPWALGLVAVFLHSLVDYPMQRFGMACWVWLMLAAAVTQRGAKARAPARESIRQRDQSLATTKH